MIAARHYRIRGRVQGVGYRFFAREAAGRWDVRGYVRNLGNGDVEIHAEAEESLLADFRQELERGPRGARVTEVIEEELPVTEAYLSFQIRV